MIFERNQPIMAYDEYLEERITRVLVEKKVDFLAKKMMGGLCYMVDDKMCLGIVHNQMMARIHPDLYEPSLQKDGVNEMNFTGRAMKGYLYINPEAHDMDEELEKWIQSCLDFNPLAKSSKKKKK
jgi:TfoX/Sxy family transcriptional regulator of competence genes